jgi:hypothetical protein
LLSSNEIGIAAVLVVIVGDDDNPLRFLLSDILIVPQYWYFISELSY